MTLDERGIIVGLKPIGGWRYPQAIAGTVTTIKPEHAPKGTHFGNFGDKLVCAVQHFRRIHNLPEGDAFHDVAEFIRRASPQNDYYRGKTPDIIGKPRLRAITPLIQELRNWIEDTMLRKPNLVNTLDAVDRGAICMGCPQNIRWQVSNCDKCNKEVETRGILLRGEVMFELDPALLACRLHKMHLQSGVFLDRDFLPARHPDAPASCWIPNTSSNEIPDLS